MRGENLKELFIAFTVALIVWFYAKMNRTYEMVVRLPVVFVNVPDNFSFVDRTDTVVVRIKGSGFALLRMRILSPRLVYDLSDAKPEGSFPVDTQYLSPKVPVIFESPGTVKYRLDKEIIKTVAVIPTLKGRPKRGYFLYGWKVENDVQVKGPKSLLENLDSLPTYPIDITGRKRDFSTTVKVFTEGLGISEVKPESVVVTILIDSIATKEVPVIFKDSSFIVILRGPSRTLARVKHLRAFPLGDSLVIPHPEDTDILTAQEDEGGDTLQR
ncbi:MAG: YbbR-like domain-containing protein [Thermotogae bacterium]|nr:YbbR-like domain-containing protein [Thermotogota bacterium]